MTAVVHSLYEKQALAWAIQFFRDRTGQLTREGSKKTWDELISGLLLEAHEVYNYSREERGQVYLSMVDGARRHSYGVQLLLGFAATLIERGEPLPEEMRGYVAELLRDPPKLKRKPGPGLHDLRSRNSAICDALRHINETWKFPITRNHYSKGPSAASVVHEAIKAVARAGHKFHLD
jgi:hypothetical protein